MKDPRLDESLAEVAVRAASLAARTCPDCGWYHGAWPLWRHLGMASAPTMHEAFYADAIARHVADGAGSRVLISGAADQGMVATVARAFLAVGATPAITILDRCPTPLALGREWAVAAGLDVGTRHVDVLDFVGSGEFDLVCTHAFLGYFTPEQRRGLAARWARALRPGGRLVTLNRLRPTAPSDPVGFTPDEARVFVDRAGAEARRIGWDPEDATARAREWTARFRMYALRTQGDIVSPLQEAGLAVHTAPVDSGDAARTAPVGPGTPGHAAYLGVVATRA